MKATSQKQCMFFVGGRDFNAVGSSRAGGCTKDWWNEQQDIDTPAGKADAMARLMAANGLPIAQGGFDVTAYGADWIAFKENESGDFTSVEVGMLLHGQDDSELSVFASAGVYKIIDRDSDWLKIQAEPHEDIAVGHVGDLDIGGAWSDLSNLMSKIDAADYSQMVHINKHLTPAASMATVDCGGDVAKNSRLLIQGFHATPGDMNIGGAYHQSAWDFKENGVDTNKNIIIDCVNSGSGFVWDDSVNITFRNIYAKNAEGGDNGGFHLSEDALGDAVGCDFINCKSTEGNYGFGGSLGFADNCHIKGCYAGNCYAGIRLSGDNNLVEGCIVKPLVTSPTYGILMHDHLEWPGGNTVRGNLVIGGNAGIWTSGHGIVENNTCIGQTIGCLVYFSESGNIPTVDLSNNILMPDFDAGGRAVTGHGGSSDYTINLRGQNNLFWYSNTSGSVPNSISDLINIGATQNDIDTDKWLFEDPLFVNSAGGDFRPENKNVLLGGMVDVGGNESVIGAVGQRWQFVFRGRVANMARLSILR